MSSFVALDYNEAHEFVRTQQEFGNDVRWDGWEIVFFRPSSKYKAVVSKSGARRGNRWGFETRIPVLTNGNWMVPKQHVLNKPVGNRPRRSGVA